MKHGMFTVIFMILISSAWALPNRKDILEESYYQSFKSKLQNKKSRFVSLNALTPFEQSLYVDALWDLVDEGNVKLISNLKESNFFHYELSEKLRVALLQLTHQEAKALSASLAFELQEELKKDSVDVKILYLLATYETQLVDAGHGHLIDLAKNHAPYFDIAEDENLHNVVPDDAVRDLFFNSPDTSTYMNGEYVQSAKIFMFCRINRLYPCLMLMRNNQGEVVRNNDGTLWNNQALASSSRGLPSYVRNGNTPSGIYTIDSVMPVADQRTAFGKFRRMILNFIPKSNEEILLKSLIPSSSHHQQWWRPSTVARDAGRNLFRIHGTGKTNEDANTPYYPFVRTSGCIAQKENTYDGVTYIDQRKLLDQIMKALKLEANYANEVKIKGVLYLIEIDNEPRAVEITDLTQRGIN